MLAILCKVDAQAEQIIEEGRNALARHQQKLEGIKRQHNSRVFSLTDKVSLLEEKVSQLEEEKLDVQKQQDGLKQQLHDLRRQLLNKRLEAEVKLEVLRAAMYN